MSQKITISDQEKLEHLIEEIRSIFSEAVFSARLTLLEAKHLVGKTIMESELYRKWKKGSGKLIKEIAKKLGRPEKDIYLCVKFYQKYPKIDLMIQTLKGKKNELTWNAVKRLLEPPKEKEHICQWETIERCIICKKIRN